MVKTRGYKKRTSSRRDSKQIELSTKRNKKSRIKSILVKTLGVVVGGAVLAMFYAWAMHEMQPTESLDAFKGKFLSYLGKVPGYRSAADKLNSVFHHKSPEALAADIKDAAAEAAAAQQSHAFAYDMLKGFAKTMHSINPLLSFSEFEGKINEMALSNFGPDFKLDNNISRDLYASEFKTP